MGEVPAAGLGYSERSSFATRGEFADPVLLVLRCFVSAGDFHGRPYFVWPQAVAVRCGALSSCGNQPRGFLAAIVQAP
eukprot:11187641-Lingulodinium_polyedra.AAC.1